MWEYWTLNYPWLKTLSENMGFIKVFGTYLGIDVLFKNRMSKWMINGVKGWYNKTRTIINIDKRVQEIERGQKEMNGKLDYLIKQTNTNGGSTIKDDTVAMKESLKNIENKIDVNDALAWGLRDFDDDGYFIADVNGNIKTVSKSILTLLGCTKDDFINKRWLKFIITEEESSNVEYEWNKHFSSETAYSKNATFINNSGTHLHIKIKAKPVPHINNTGIVAWVGTFQKIS